MYGAHKPLNGKHTAGIYTNVGRNVLIALPGTGEAPIGINDRSGDAKVLVTDALQRLINSGYTCYVLPCAGGATCGNERREQAVWKRLIKRSGSAIWLQAVERQYLSLLNKIDYVVAAGGPTGFDAMLLGKPVIHLGPLAYTLREHSLAIDDLTRGTPSTLNARERIISTRKIATLMLRHYLVPRSFAFDYNYFIAAV